jgi:NAD+ synthase (glutamine-hydrolysing)
MPNYGKFDDKRHFTSGKDRIVEQAMNSDISLGELTQEKYSPVEMILDGVKRKVGVLICEDMWDEDYRLKLAEMYKNNGADLLVNISASPAGIDKERKREQLIARHSR